MHWLATFFIGLLSLMGVGHVSFIDSVATTTPAHPVDTSGAPLRIPIFIYHTTKPEDPQKPSKPTDYVTDPSLLDEQLTYLDTHGYTTVTMKQVADMLKRGTTSPYIKPVALTFDDGWVTQYKYALPLLKKHHVQSTFYIYPNPIGKDDRFMTWDELKEVRDSGAEIADHTLTHPLMSKQTPEMLHHEMYDSKTILEEKLGVKITDFASPFGYTSPVVVEELKRDGYETGRTTNAGFTHTSASHYALDAYLVHKTMKDFEWAIEHGK